MSLKNTFCPFCKSTIYRKVPSYESDRFIIADIHFNLFFKLNLISTQLRNDTEWMYLAQVTAFFF